MFLLCCCRCFNFFEQNVNFAVVKNSLDFQAVVKAVVIRKSLSRRQAVIKQTSGSFEPVVRQSSRSHLEVSGSHQVAVRQFPGSFKESSGIFCKLLDSHEVKGNSIVVLCNDLFTILHICHYRGSPTYAVFTTADPTSVTFGFWMCKWGIIALVGDPYSPTNANFA